MTTNNENARTDQLLAPHSLRVCCYGSSSSATPQRYLDAAYELGRLLAVRGHVCVNGAGSFGCMSSLNQGAADHDGHIVGVIHEMWLQNREDAVKALPSSSATYPQNLRDGGAHAVFSGTSSNKNGSRHHGRGPIREMLVAGGNDLQERKKLLVQDAAAVIVLPGGPGTWDELWEMACARNIGLSSLPIVCVNIDAFYTPFLHMLQRAYDDQLTKRAPHDIVHFVDTPVAAVEFVEAECRKLMSSAMATPKQSSSGRKTMMLRSASVLHDPLGATSLAWRNLRQSISGVVSDKLVSPSPSPPPPNGEGRMNTTSWFRAAVCSAVGIAIGLLLADKGCVRHNKTLALEA